MSSSRQASSWFSISICGCFWVCTICWLLSLSVCRYACHCRCLDKLNSSLAWRWSAACAEVRAHSSCAYVHSRRLTRSSLCYKASRAAPAKIPVVDAPHHALVTKHQDASPSQSKQPFTTTMFSPQPASRDSAADRRRPRPSRPTSRVQQRADRPASAMSTNDGGRESPLSSHRQGSDSIMALAGDRKPTTISGKEQDTGVTDLVGPLRAPLELRFFNTV